MKVLEWVDTGNESWECKLCSEHFPSDIALSVSRDVNAAIYGHDRYVYVGELRFGEMPVLQCVESTSEEAQKKIELVTRRLIVELVKVVLL